ncbi:MAG: hypothetical protein CME32_01220 [Gimesia sp.]|nr:hypothetical protein [Gimesia sp.]
MGDEIEIKLATTEAERHQAYHLRYQVFTREFGDERYADHVNEEFRDEDDGEQSHLVIGEINSNVICTARVTVLRDYKFLAADHFKFGVLAKYLGRDQFEIENTLARYDRLALMPSWRGKGIARKIYEGVEKTAFNNNCKIIVANPLVENDKARLVLSRQGFSDYPVVGTYKGTTCQCMYKVLEMRALAKNSNVKNLCK